MGDELINDRWHLDETLLYRIHHDYQREHEMAELYALHRPPEPQRVLVFASNYRAGHNVATMDHGLRRDAFEVITRYDQLRGPFSPERCVVIFVDYPESFLEAERIYREALRMGITTLPSPFQPRPERRHPRPTFRF